MRPPRNLTTLVAWTLVAATLSGCYPHGQGMLSSIGFTKLGYVPASLSHTWGDTAQGDTDTLAYPDVRRWAESVADGYDTRSTFNRHSIYIGAFVAAAAAGALAGLGAFDPSNSAITGIPIGTAFLGSVASYYHNEDKAKLYERANSAIVALIALADYRCLHDPSGCKAGEATTGLTDTATTITATTTKKGSSTTTTLPDTCTSDADPRRGDPKSCLRWDVEAVMRQVNEQRLALDPQNVNQDLKESATKVKNALEAGGLLDEANRKKVTAAAVDKLLADVNHLLGDDFLRNPQTVCCLPVGYLGEVALRKPVVPTTTTTTTLPK